MSEAYYRGLYGQVSERIFQETSNIQPGTTDNWMKNDEILAENYLIPEIKAKYRNCGKSKAPNVLPIFSCHGQKVERGFHSKEGWIEWVDSFSTPFSFHSKSMECLAFESEEKNNYECVQENWKSCQLLKISKVSNYIFLEKKQQLSCLFDNFLNEPDIKNTFGVTLRESSRFPERNRKKSGQNNAPPVPLPRNKTVTQSSSFKRSNSKRNFNKPPPGRANQTFSEDFDFLKNW